MVDTQVSNHSDMMKLKAKGRHRRVQSNTAFDMTALLDRRPDPEKFESLANIHNVMDSNATQQAIDASNKPEVEKELIVDDIDEIPNTGYIIPKSYQSDDGNPLMFIKKRNLSVCTSNLNNTCPVKRIDLLNELKNIDDLIGLNTIMEKRNSMEDIDIEALEQSSIAESQTLQPEPQKQASTPTLQLGNASHSTPAAVTMTPKEYSKTPSTLTTSKTPHEEIKKKATSKGQQVTATQQNRPYRFAHHTKNVSADLRPTNKEPQHTPNYSTTKEIERSTGKKSTSNDSGQKSRHKLHLDINSQNANDFFEKRNRYLNERAKGKIKNDSLSMRYSPMNSANNNSHNNPNNRSTISTGNGSGSNTTLSNNGSNHQSQKNFSVNHFQLPNNVNKQKAQYFLQLLEKSKTKKVKEYKLESDKPSSSFMNISSTSPNIAQQQQQPQPNIQNIVNGMNPTLSRNVSLGQLQGSVGQWKDSLNYSLTPTNMTLSNAKSFKDLTSDPHRIHHQREDSNIRPTPFNNNYVGGGGNNGNSGNSGNNSNVMANPQLENKVNVLDETVKLLTSKTSMLEEQVRSLCEVIESMRREKFDLEQAVTTQNEQIKHLQQQTSRYEEEINFLKTKSTTDSDKKDTLRNDTFKNMNENGGILNTTDGGSNAESPFGECSGFYSHKEIRNKYQTLNPYNNPAPFNVNNYNSTANITQKIENNNTNTFGKTLINKANKRYSDKFTPTPTPVTTAQGNQQSSTPSEYKTTLKKGEMKQPTRKSAGRKQAYYGQKVK